ncbi:MAG TPA: response regulator [Pyrinomonadaceae bacterium]|nr:response regulator [Pyrinomonadaceae bacterium]
MLSGRRKLLIADDSPTIQKVINLTFEDEDIEVVAVSDGEQALRILEEQTPPDILLADIWMPGPNGYELCERVKRDARLRHVPVILLVGAFEPFNEAEARRVGADTVLTKPFQSIRDLVSKVGSLLGGESKREEETPAQRSRTEESADEAMTLQADVPMQHIEANAPAADSFGGPGGPLGRHDAASSFGDFGADDELIEAKPADSFGVVANETKASREDAHAFAEEPSHEPSATQEQAVAPAQEQPFAPHAFSESSFESRAHEPVESAVAAPRSFAARAAASAPADDALLDLGQIDAPASSGADDEDDFVLDIDLDEPTPSTPWQYAPEAQSGALSALAEAAHGGGSDAAFNESTSPFNESVMPSEPVEHAASALVERHDAPAAEVVMQDEPQPFDAHEVGVAPRGFVEPSVVPADAPVPTMVEPEFTDGSVEGDVAKAPVGVYTTQPVADEPSTAGYAVGEARAGLEEPLRADQLSPEAIDKIARRVVELMSDKVVREIAWEVVPDLAELLIKRKLDEGKQN